MIVSGIGADHVGIGARAAGHFEIALRRMMTGPCAVQNARYLRLVTGEAHPMGNLAIVTEPGDLAGALEAATPLLDCGAPAAAIFPRGVDAEVADALRARGFALEATIPAMAVEIDHMPPVELADGYEWTRVGDGEPGRAWAETLAVGYGLPRALADLYAPAALGAEMTPDAPIQFFAVLREGRQVATSMLFLADGLAGIYCVATRPEERNKGLGAYATAEALHAARQLGYRVGVLQSSEAGYKVYLALGFSDYAKVPMLIHATGGS